MTQGKRRSAEIAPDDQAAISSAAQAEQRRATKAVKKAKAEPALKAKAMAFEKKERQKQVPKKDSDMLHALRGEPIAKVDETPAAAIGDCCQVTSDLKRRGPARHGGAGRIVEVDGVGGKTTVAVKYHVGGEIEKDIGVERLTHAADPAQQARPTRPRPPAPVKPQRSPAVHPLASLPLHTALERANSANRRPGWRREQHFGQGRPSRFEQKEKTVALGEYTQLKGYLAGSEAAGGRSSKHAARQKSGTGKGQFVQRTRQFDPYVLFWVG